MLANGWELTTLGEVMEFKNGLNFTKADSGQLIKIVGVSDFKNHSELKDLNNLEVVNIAKIRDGELLTDGDLLFVRSNGNKNLIGRCLFFPKVNERVSFSGFTIRGRANQKRVIPDYIATLAISPLMKQQISRNGGGTNISNLSQQILNDIVFALPPMSEQKKITQIISTWNKAIATTEKLLANSQKQKQALMQQLLTGKKRFPEFNQDWISLKIGSLLKEIKRPIEWCDEQDYQLLSVKRRSEGIVLREVLKGHQILTKKMNLAHKGDFLISKMQVVHGAMGLVTEVFDKHHISDSYIILAPKNKDSIDIHFFSWYCKHPLMYHKAYLCSYGVHIEKMTFNLQMFMNEYICIPPTIEEQQKIAKLLSIADDEIETLQDKLNHLKDEKKALMQQLLTGKRRVKVIQ